MSEIDVLRCASDARWALKHSESALSLPASILTAEDIAVAEAYYDHARRAMDLARLHTVGVLECQLIRVRMMLDRAVHIMRSGVAV